MPFIHDSDLPLPFLVKSHIDIADFSPSLSIITMSGGAGHNEGYRQASAGTLSTSQALELARDSEEGAEDSVVVSVLENAINIIWGKVQSKPTTYVMTRDEFAVFNYFQSRFEGQPIAIEARRRYWNSLQATVEGGGST